MDDKNLSNSSLLNQYSRPILKSLVKQKWISKALFKYAANRQIIETILKQVYPSKHNIDQELIDILYKPSQRENASEAFYGFINIFNDHFDPILLLSVMI